MPDFATDDDKGVSRKRSRSQVDRQITETVIRRLMSDQIGRRWIWLELASMHIFTTINYFGEDAERRTYFAGGERNVGLRLLANVMRLCSKEYVLAMEENTKLEKENVGRPNTANEYGDSPEAGPEPGVDGS
jgi:hypothetical protein